MQAGYVAQSNNQKGASIDYRLSHLAGSWVLPTPTLLAPCHNHNLDTPFNFPRLPFPYLQSESSSYQRLLQNQGKPT